MKNYSSARSTWRQCLACLSIFLVILVGHSQAQQMVQVQPMKMAAVEALWEIGKPGLLLAVYRWG